MPRRKREAGDAPGNFVSEWFGHRTYPTVASYPDALSDQTMGRCPFLSVATGELRRCVKREGSFGVCTISNASNGPRQDWLVCPFRTLDAAFVETIARRLFNVPPKQPVSLLPASALLNLAARESFQSALRGGTTGFVYLQAKLGGEISVSETARSPEFAFDFTMVEILHTDAFVVGRFGVVEVQTMDFHGSYRRVVNNLKSALHLHPTKFAETIAENQQWLGERIEGPNVANVFKRTFYQTVLKFRFASNATCAGCVLAIPLSVWESWQKHLGRPALQQEGDGTFTLRRPDGSKPDKSGWIVIFDLESRPGSTPCPVVVRQVISTDAKALYLHAFEVVPQAAQDQGMTPAMVLQTIHSRLTQ